MKIARTVINILILLGIVLSTYFLHLSLTPEGYTGRILWFTYDVHSPRNPLILLGLLVLALVIVNWRQLLTMRYKLRLLGMSVAVVIILAGVFFFLTYKRHNRLPWERPNVLVIVVDTLRADHVSAYNKNNARTPNIDALAEEGWLFERAYSHIPITMPSHASLFTGRLPHDVWVLNNNDEFNFPQQTLAEILNEEGYKTAAVVSLGVLKAKFNLDRGFDYYNDKLPRNGQWYNRADVVTDRGIKWLDSNLQEEDRFFLWLHYSDPHEPYNPPGSPPDTSVALNGESVIEGSLESSAFVEARLILNPGRNEVVISRLGDNDKMRLYFTSVYFPGMEKSELPENWTMEVQGLKRAGLARRVRSLQEGRFLTDFNGLEFAGMRFAEGDGWSKPITESTRPRREVSGTWCSMYIENASNEPKEVILRLKGGVNKDISSVREDYKDEVEFADKEIGRFIEHLKIRDLMDNTIIVLLSDHGEELNEHGMIGHIHYLYTQSLQVPLIIRDPDTDHRGEHLTRLARLCDVAPTILDMVGLHKPTYMQGKTLLEYVLRNRSDERVLEAETFRSNARQDRAGILDGDWLTIYNPDLERLRQIELFNLEEDDIQWRNLSLADKRPGQMNTRAKQVSDFWESMDLVRVEGRENDSSSVEDLEDQEMLGDLGYMQHGRPILKLDRGVPSDALIAKINQEISAFSPEIRLTIEARQSTGNGPHYLYAEIYLPVNTVRDTIMALQDEVLKKILPEAEDFPLHMRILAGQEIIYDQVLADD